VIGANIGGALAPYMAQSGADVAARRVPLANLMTRAIVGVALLPFLGQAVDWLTLVDASTTRLPVNFHTAFNVVAALVFLPLVDVVAWPAAACCPTNPTIRQPRHSIPTCSIAVEALERPARR
jgi:phosphate:Na+ symporter